MKEFLNQNKIWIKIAVICYVIYFISTHILPIIGIDLSNISFKIGNGGTARFISIYDIPLLGTAIGIAVIAIKALIKLIKW